MILCPAEGTGRSCGSVRSLVVRWASVRAQWQQTLRRQPAAPAGNDHREVMSLDGRDGKSSLAGPGVPPCHVLAQLRIRSHWCLMILLLPCQKMNFYSHSADSIHQVRLCHKTRSCARTQGSSLGHPATPVAPGLPSRCCSGLVCLLRWGAQPGLLIL